MTHRLARTAATLAATAGLTLGGLAPAGAAQLTVPDSRGDVVSFQGDSETWSAAPGVRNHDVLRTTFTHTDRRVRVRVKYAELLRKGAMGGHIVQLTTNEGLRRDVTVVAVPGMWRGEAEMTRRDGKPVRCAVAHRIDYDRNVVTMSFPRTCISSPRWVRLGLGSMWADDATGTSYADDAQLAGKINDAGLRLSGRIRRG